MNDNDFNPNDEPRSDENFQNFENVDSQSNETTPDISSVETTEEPNTVPEEEKAPEDSFEDLHSNSEQPNSSEEPKTDANEQQPTNPYQQQYGQWQQGNYRQQPYTPYGQGYQSNPNNAYRPYGQNGQYGQYGQYGPYTAYNPYGQPQNQNHTYEPYGQYQPQPDGQPPKKKMNGGLKAFLWIIGALAVLFVLGFCIYGIYSTYQNGNTSREKNWGSSSSQQLPSSSGQTGNNTQGNVNGNGTNPNSSGLSIENQPTTGELSAKEVYNKVAPSVVSVVTSVKGTSSGSGSGESQGSGIVATADGYIITNAHVVNYSKNYQVKVILYNKKEYTGTVVGFDKTTDLAVIKINANDLTPAKFGNADNLSVGDWVLAIGNPAGVEFSSSLTRGIISALNRKVENYSNNGMTYIQTDAAINPGNSGGALVNMYGQVVGINSIKIVATGYEGMGFAIPLSKAKSIVDALITRGYVSGRTRLGITAATVTPSQAQQYGVPQGVAIDSVDKDSSLKGADVVKGDIITKADGKTVTSMEDLYGILNSHKPNDTLTLTIYRAGDSTTKSKTFTVTIRLLEDKGETQGTVSSSSSR